MDARTSYSPSQLTDAEAMARKLAELPQEKQAAVVMMANAFMAGLEAQARLAAQAAQ